MKVRLSQNVVNLCMVTMGDMQEKFGEQLEKLTDMEIDALLVLALTYKLGGEEE